VRLSQKQSVIIGTGSIVMFFILGIALLQQDQLPDEETAAENKSQELKAESQSASESQPEETSGPRLTLDKFHRSETREGKKIWEVRADHGEYYPATGIATINKAVLHIFNETEGAVELNAGSATLHISGNTLSKAEAFNGVEIRYDNDIAMVTETATYEMDQNIISAPGHVHISSERFEVSGYILRANVESQEFTLHKNVKSILKPNDY